METNAMSTVSTSRRVARPLAKRTSGAIRHASRVRGTPVSLSPARYADLVVGALEAIGTPPDIRVPKIRAIRQRIGRGTYSPSAAAIARRLVGI
jgi:anti-sigma28 factor (negative regulator of flagellin synthesis)